MKITLQAFLVQIWANITTSGGRTTGWLAKTTLDTKFHFSNSKNKDLQYNGTLILPDYIILMIQIVKLGKKWLTFFYRLAKTTLDTKFHVSNSKNKDLQYNGTLILPDYIILMIQISKLGKKWLTYFYRLAKTTLDTKFHFSNSKNKDLQYNGTLILIDYIILMIQIVKSGKKWLTYFYRLPKTTLGTNFHVSNSKNKDLLYNGTFILLHIPMI
jgi:hypothetical protein